MTTTPPKKYDVMTLAQMRDKLDQMRSFASKMIPEESHSLPTFEVFMELTEKERWEWMFLFTICESAAQADLDFTLDTIENALHGHQRMLELLGQHTQLTKPEGARLQ